MKWKKYKEGEKKYLSVLRSDLGGDGKYEGYYIGFPDEGDSYITIPELLKLESE